MAISASKVAPLGVVLAFVGYCAWPSIYELTSSSHQPKKAAKAPEIAASLFSPTLPPPPTKSPWGGKDAATLAAQRKAAKSAEASLAAAAGSRGTQTSYQRANPLADVKLDATCIFGDRRLAVINGHLYAAQDAVLPVAPGRRHTNS